MIIKYENIINDNLNVLYTDKTLYVIEHYETWIKKWVYFQIQNLETFLNRNKFHIIEQEIKRYKIYLYKQKRYLYKQHR